jgi:hypothetical protein
MAYKFPWGIFTSTARTLSDGDKTLPSLNDSGDIKAEVTNFPATQPVSIDSLPSLSAGSAAIGTVEVTSLPSLPTGGNAIGSVSVSNLPSDPATATGVAVVATSVGTTNESVAGSDTATSGLNGLVKRLLQRITTLISNVGATDDTMASSDTGSFGLVALAKRLLSVKLGSSVTKAIMHPGGQGIEGWVSQIAHDSYRFRHETISQHGEIRTARKRVQLHIMGSFPITVLRDRTTLVSSGTVTKSGGEYLIATAAGANSSARIDSVHRGSYVCGLGAIAEFSICVPTAPTGQQVGEWYYADSTDGYGFGVDSTGVYVWYMKASSKTKIYQSNWNNDKLDGNGDSGVNLLLSNGAVFYIDFTWFGYGIVEWGVLSTAIDGRQHKIICHYHQTSGGQSTDNVNLPIGVSASNGTATTAFTVAVGGRAFSILGDYEISSRSISVHQNFSMAGSINTDQYVMSIRKKSSSGFVSVKAIVDVIEAYSVTRDCLVKIVANPTLTGASWVAPTGTNASETACEFDNSATYTSGSGIILYQFIVSGGAPTIPRIGGALSNIEIPDSFAVAVILQNQTNSTGVVRISKSWKEDW